MGRVLTTQLAAALALSGRLDGPTIIDVTPEPVKRVDIDPPADRPSRWPQHAKEMNRIPHQGERERARRRRQMQKKAAKP